MVLLECQDPQLTQARIQSEWLRRSGLPYLVYGQDAQRAIASRLPGTLLIAWSSNLPSDVQKVLDLVCSYGDHLAFVIKPGFEVAVCPSHPVRNGMKLDKVCVPRSINHPIAFELYAPPHFPVAFNSASFSWSGYYLEPKGVTKDE